MLVRTSLLAPTRPVRRERTTAIADVPVHAAKRTPPVGPRPPPFRPQSACSWLPLRRCPRPVSSMRPPPGIGGDLTDGACPPTLTIVTGVVLVRVIARQYVKFATLPPGAKLLGRRGDRRYLSWASLEDHQVDGAVLVISGSAVTASPPAMGENGEGRKRRPAKHDRPPDSRLTNQ